MPSDWDRIVKILKEKNLHREPEVLQLDLAFQKQGIDSLDLAGIFLALEDEFKVKLLDNPLKRAKSFREILATIERSRAMRP